MRPNVSGIRQSMNLQYANIVDTILSTWNSILTVTDEKSDIDWLCSGEICSSNSIKVELSITNNYNNNKWTARLHFEMRLLLRLRDDDAQTNYLKFDVHTFSHSHLRYKWFDEGELPIYASIAFMQLWSENTIPIWYYEFEKCIKPLKFGENIS